MKLSRRDLFKGALGMLGAALLPKLPDVSTEVESEDLGTRQATWAEPHKNHGKVVVFLTWRGDTWDITEGVDSISTESSGAEKLSLNLKPNDLDTLQMLGEQVALQVFMRAYEPGCPVFEGDYLLRSVAGDTLELEPMGGDYMPRWTTPSIDNHLTPTFN